MIPGASTSQLEALIDTRSLKKRFALVARTEIQQIYKDCRIGVLMFDNQHTRKIQLQTVFYPGIQQMKHFIHPSTYSRKILL